MTLTTNEQIIKTFIARVERAFPLDLDDPTNEDVDYKLSEIMNEIRAEIKEQNKMNEYLARDWQERSNW
jgi:hypothetical protein